ncbi:peptide deformylase [Verrucomicrobiaceae bacterium R5-34]|uniref:Peptide deformylase n=1 Tax=Oceaniferula flava TaxID=2800421 RepID=A0AAE2SH34_9BACT|nr:peptide deformylase [Oceaniferula flavus]MBK1829760.1 peptide deformylase [Verrucomicrobiaceae bacterium R5-34]MBK1856435.1 peptide deformylase [Oceaniferula flavus]MBM1137742.1 peptide deformylase [Oceaniferula flavus]
MILDITQYGDPVLRKKCKPVQVVDETILKLAEDMVETMVDANGVGLAAPQVGEELRMAVVDVSHDPDCVSFLKVNGEDAKMEDIMPLIFINPELELDGPRESDSEGCLSIHDIRANVRRPTIVKAKLELLDGSIMELETDGLFARAIQHEVDHLNGTLFVDRISPAAKVSIKRKLRRLAAHQG